MKNKFAIVVSAVILLLLSLTGLNNPASDKKKEDIRPKIINIINFIRLLEPRDPLITKEVLYETVVKQVEILKQYHLRGTFLLQYDALLDPRYQNLLKSLPADSFEIGAWWEIPQPLVENAGMKWRGRFPWDWHADVGFSTGYDPADREKLVDVYMKDFKKIFGYYPQSVGSWFIDEHTLYYMYKKYGIVASTNCKDQIGTDGYTLWGGYWNQAYYPSKKNAYMPAQNAENQIPVPIFRMLGSDPVRQYDNGIGNTHQGVVTLEPVYPKAGGDSAWVHWYMQEFTSGECMEYAYTQAGQENSFIWSSVEKGFKLQMPLIARLSDQKKVRVETLAESGKWFREHYNVTPATSVTINEDLGESDIKTVWFNSRFYRANLFWEQGTMRFRDIHLFNEKIPSKYLSEKVNSNECHFFTLPFIDGHSWSSSNQKAGLKPKALVNGKEIFLEGGAPVVTNPTPGSLHIVWPLKNIEGNFIFDLNEQLIIMSMEGQKSLRWFLDLTTYENAVLPFQKISSTRINGKFEQFNYSVIASKGLFSIPSDSVIFRITPQNNFIILDLNINPDKAIETK